MSSAPSILFWVILGLLGYGLATSFFAVLGARIHFETRRHDLIVRSKQLRREYLNSADERLAGVLDDDEWHEDDASEDATMADAA